MCVCVFECLCVCVRTRERLCECVCVRSYVCTFICVNVLQLCRCAMHAINSSPSTHLFATSGTTSDSPGQRDCSNTRLTTKWPSIALPPLELLPLPLPLPLLLLLLLPLLLLLLLLFGLLLVLVVCGVGRRNISITARTSSSTASRRAGSLKSNL